MMLLLFTPLSPFWANLVCVEIMLSPLFCIREERLLWKSAEAASVSAASPQIVIFIGAINQVGSVIITTAAPWRGKRKERENRLILREREPTSVSLRSVWGFGGGGFVASCRRRKRNSFLFLGGKLMFEKSQHFTRRLSCSLNRAS